MPGESDKKRFLMIKLKFWKKIINKLYFNALRNNSEKIAG
jgi:hypothetical protein